MKAYIDMEACISCGLCEDTLPSYFEFKDGRVEIRKAEIGNADQQQLTEMAEDCPGGALSLSEGGCS